MLTAVKWRHVMSLSTPFISYFKPSVDVISRAQGASGWSCELSPFCMEEVIKKIYNSSDGRGEGASNDGSYGRNIMLCKYVPELGILFNMHWVQDAAYSLHTWFAFLFDMMK